MLSNILIFSFLLIPPAILFAIPRTRRMTGSWLTAWKTVPLGCMTMLLVPAAFFGAWELLSDFQSPADYSTVRHWFNTGGLLLGLALGTWLTVFLARKIWCRYHAEGKRSFVAFVPVFLYFVGGAMAIVVICFFLPAEAEWGTFRLPKETGFTLEQKHIHLFLAEYDYRIRFQNNTYRKLHINAGGHTYFNVYRLKGNRFCLSDKDCSYLVEPQTQTVWRLSPDLKYMAPAPTEACNNWGWSTEEDGSMVFHHNKQEVQVIPVPDDLKEKVYYGCITTQFTPAEESPEQLIESRW